MKPFITVVFVITFAFLADLLFNGGKYSINLASQPLTCFISSSSGYQLLTGSPLPQ